MTLPAMYPKHFWYGSVICPISDNLQIRKQPILVLSRSFIPSI